MTDKDMLSTREPEAVQLLAADICELKELLRNIYGKITLIETRVKNLFPSDFTFTNETDSLTEDQELAAMARDPEIQAEIAAINKEFAVAEMDGLSGL